MVSVAVAVSFWNVGTTAFIDVSGPIADSASIQGADTVVDVIADAVGIGIRGTGPTTDAEGIELVSVAVAVAIRDVGTTAFVDVAGSVADSASVERSDTVVDVIANAVGICVC